MAMHGFDKEDFSAPMAEINTTPLVDVMLVLMVIFLVTAPMLTQAVKLELPGEAAAEILDEKPVVISILQDGAYYWADEQVKEPDLEMRIKTASVNNAEQPIHIRADINVAYGRVSNILSLAQQHGMSNIAFVTEPK